MMVHDDNTTLVTGSTADHYWYVTNTSVELLSWLQHVNMTRVLTWPPDTCSTWQPLHHVYWQVAQLILVLATLVPLTSDGTVSVVVLRLGLVTYSGLSLLWSCVTSCSLDSLVWAAAILIINTIHAIITLVSIHVSNCSAIHSDILPAYDKMFKPLGVTRKQFQKLLDCSKELKVVSAKETVITEKISRVDCLSLVLSGRLLVSQAGKPLHLVNQNQFLDSPEWFGVTTDEFFQVTVTALEPSSILTWHRDKVKFCLMEDPRLEAIFDHVVGRDVVRKLMQVNNLTEELQQMMRTGDSGGDSSSGHSDTGGDEAQEWADDKKPMISKEKEKSLLGSLMGGDLPSWRLVNIKETEANDETIV